MVDGPTRYVRDVTVTTSECCSIESSRESRVGVALRVASRVSL